MADSNEIEITNRLNMGSVESLKTEDNDKESENTWVSSESPKGTTALDSVETSKESFNVINDNFESTSGSEFSSTKSISGECLDTSKSCFDEPVMNFSAVSSGSQPLVGQNLGLDSFRKSEVKSSDKSKEKDIVNDSALQKMRILLEAYTESSSSSDTQAAPAVETSSPQQNSTIRTDFKNAICKETVDLPTTPVLDTIIETDVKPVCLEPSEPNETKPPLPEITIISVDENTVSATAPEDNTKNNTKVQTFTGPIFPPSLPEASDQPSCATESQPEVKIEAVEQQPEVPPQPIPIIPPAPRKRGRPRKQVLPNPIPPVEWPPGQEPKFEIPKEEKRAARAERRQTKRRKLDDDGENRDEKRRQRASQAQKKKKRSTYVPKKKLAAQRKKHSEMENIQNFEEETRMSASEGPTGFSSRSGGLGDESQSGSMTTEGHTRSSINKKGRMEVGTDGCKPVTVQQIVEYYWPPPSSLPYGEKSDALMIQEQICEYLGCKSFKRKYPSIKRRPVDMEERTYLQENGYVSENMCDMGLTAVLAGDILEIMYNDFPHKFDEYRKYSREKKMKEQRVPKAMYNSQVLVGNWFEENYRDEHKLAMYCKQKERRNLLVIRIRKSFDSFLQHIPLSLRTRGLVYGDTIMLMAPDVYGDPYNKNEKGVVLAATLRPKEIERINTLIDDLFLVGSPIKRACARNAFILEPCGDKKMGDEVCYGDTFSLKSACGSDIPLYVELLNPGLGAPAGDCGFPNPTLTFYKNLESRFMILHRNPSERFLITGNPCPALERIVITCASNNIPLCAEDQFWSLSFFSHECEVSPHFKVDRAQRPLPQNLWMFVGGVNA